MNRLVNSQEPPSGQGWTPSGTCGGRWSRVLPNGIFETWTPLPANGVIIANSATAGSPWELNAPASRDGGPLTAHDTRAMVIEINTLRAANVALRASNEAYEQIEYGTPNPDELRVELAQAKDTIARIKGVLRNEPSAP